MHTYMHQCGRLADLVGEGANGRHERSRQAEVGDLQTAVSRHQDVLRLEVAVTRGQGETRQGTGLGCSPVHDPSHVAVVQATQQLACIGLRYISVNVLFKGWLFIFYLLGRVVAIKDHHRPRNTFSNLYQRIRIPNIVFLRFAPHHLI